MIKTATPTAVSDIFSINSDKIYKIPKYQRQYIWGKNEWNALFTDITENEEGYFLGSYICVNNGSLGDTVLEVIDGQQRFTTLTLLLTAIYAKLSDYSDDMEVEELTELANIRNMLTKRKSTFSSNRKKKTEYSQRLFLQSENSNDVDYSYILSSTGITTFTVQKPNNFGNRRIAKAFNYFCGLIDEEVEKINETDPNMDDVSILFQIAAKFQSAVLVGIEVDTNKDAYMLFESLNHRGMPLSALDLIKNSLIAQSEKSSDADETYEKWKNILSLIGEDDHSVQERFFRQYYNAFREELNADRPSKEKKYYYGYLATRTTLIGIYEKLIKDDYSALLADLTAKAEKYSVIVVNSDRQYVYSDSLESLSQVMGTPSYILMLYVLSYQSKLKLTDDQIKEVVDILIKFFVRRNLTDLPNTRKLTALFMDIIEKIKTKTGKQVISIIKKELRNVSADDSQFEEALRGDIYDENPEMTRFVLCGIEETYQTKEIYTDLWERDSNNKYIWTIEHIFPEGENIPKSWVDMIAKGDRDKANELREEYVHTIGNLTITGYNQKLSNFSFEQKKTRQSKGKNIGYKNGLFLNQDVVNEKEWTIRKIKVRTDKLVALILDLYKW